MSALGNASPDRIARPDAAAGGSPRERFRRFLLERVTTAHVLQFYVDQAVPQFAHDAEVRLAVEELVDHAGRLLGFAVERDERWSGWSVWTSPAMARLIVDVQTPAGAVAGLGRLGRRRDEALPADECPAEPATGVTVLCGQGNRRMLEDAVTVRHAASQVRLITVGALIRLVAHARAGRASHAQVLTVLRPAAALADPLVSLLETIP